MSEDGNGVAPSSHGLSAAASQRREGITRLVMGEVTRTYVTPAERAAYRAGMSTAAAICDVVSFSYNPNVTRTETMLKGCARHCGDEIMRFRELVKVDEPRGLSAAEEPISSEGATHQLVTPKSSEAAE